MSRNLKSYSQNEEDLLISTYFGAHAGTLLEVGSNNGITLSNSRLLIEQGWSAHLIEPGKTFSNLVKLYYTNSQVSLYNHAIGVEASSMTFYESGAHVAGGDDQGLVSSLNFEETERWRKSGVDFTESNVEVKPFGTWWKEAGEPKLDFISIDAEGYDWDILKQIDLDAVGCRCLCIEWNGDQKLGYLFTEYCKGFKVLHTNRENIIFVR